jgi:hypothetical protein
MNIEEWLYKLLKLPIEIDFETLKIKMKELLKSMPLEDGQLLISSVVISNYTLRIHNTILRLIEEIKK